MRQDQQTFQRGVTAALLGGAVQLGVALALLVMALWIGGAALEAATWHAFGGLGVWLVLVLVYQQHRLVQLEAMETEELSRAHGAESSIFETSADELARARKRLERFQKWGLPIASFVTAAYLVGVGGWLALGNAELLQAQPLGAEALTLTDRQAAVLGEGALGHKGPVALLLFGLAFIGFVISRYIAGMGRLGQWSMLRGGAGYLMGSTLIAAVIAIGYALLYGTIGWLLKGLAVAVPAVMIILGAEMVVNLVLTVYRPRKPGEMPKPAFDSRVLSLLTTPESIARTINEAINYQFGFEITRSWFWQLLSRAAGYLVLLGIAVLLIASCFVVVKPDQQAIVTRFGQVVPADRASGAWGHGPGLLVKLPWPIDSVQRYDVTAIRRIGLAGGAVGLKEDVAILWTNEHYEGDPVNLIVAQRGDLPETDRFMPSVNGVDRPIAGPDAAPPDVEAPLREGVNDGDGGDGTGDQAATDQPAAAPAVSLVNAEVFVDYQIENLRQYVTAAARESRHGLDGMTGADRVLRDVAELTLSRYLYRRDIDGWLGVGRSEASGDLRAMIQALADERELGVRIVAVSVASIHPPAGVAEAFHRPIEAEQERLATIERARQQAIQTLVEAAGTRAQAERIREQIELKNRMEAEGGAEAALREQRERIETLVLAAGGEAAEMLARARADRWSTENSERGRVALFNEQRLAYRAAPDYYRLQEYLDALEAGLAEARKFVLLADRDQTTLRFDFKDIDTGLGGLDLGNTDADNE